jgi:ribosomal protein S18 acetylase RimI-like enzyme
VRFVPRWAARLLRLYVGWQEKGVKHISVEMRLADLQAWRGHVCIPRDCEIASLAQCGDEWLLRKVYNEAARDSVGFRFARVIDMIAFTAGANYDPAGIFLIRQRGHCFGTCVARVRPDGTGGIYSMSVHPDYRRKGMARGLLRQGLLYLQTKGVERVSLWAHPENERAITLYLTEGFEIVRPLEPDVPEPRWIERHPVTGSERRAQRAAQNRCLPV